MRPSYMLSINCDQDIFIFMFVFFITFTLYFESLISFCVYVYFWLFWANIDSGVVSFDSPFYRFVSGKTNQKTQLKLKRQFDRLTDILTHCLSQKLKIPTPTKLLNIFFQIVCICCYCFTIKFSEFYFRYGFRSLLLYQTLCLSLDLDHYFQTDLLVYWYPDSLSDCSGEEHKLTMQIV